MKLGKWFNVLLVLACFVCTRIMVVLQYRNLLLLCGGISKPVVHCRSLIYSLLHCSLYVCSVCELNAISTVLWPFSFFFFSVHGVTMTGNEWSAAFDDAHLRVWRATINIKQDYTKGILLLKPLLTTSTGISRGHLSNNLIYFFLWQARSLTTNLCFTVQCLVKPHELEFFFLVWVLISFYIIGFSHRQYERWS